MTDSAATILIVDDDLVSAELADMALEAAGHSVLIAALLPKDEHLQDALFNPRSSRWRPKPLPPSRPTRPVGGMEQSGCSRQLRIRRSTHRRPGRPCSSCRPLGCRQ